MKNNQNDLTTIHNHDEPTLGQVTEDTPLPQPQFNILLLVRFAEPVAFTFLFPFIYRMIADLNVAKNEAQIGYYVGWIASSFAIAQACTTILWGMLSDRWGRKPVVLLGIFGTGTSMLLFGLSKSFAWAIVTRFLSGALNGNVAVVKSMVAELTDDSNRAKGFSMLPMMFGIGSIFGPIIGGFLYNPAENFPQLFGNIQFFKDYPCFLPCFVISSLCYICLIIGWFYLEETLPSKRAKLAMYNVSEENDETSLLIDNGLNSPPYKNYSQIPSSSSTIVNQENVLNDQESLKSVATLPLTQRWNFSHETKMSILGYTLLSLMSVMMDELFSIWGPTGVDHGGVNFKPRDLALIQTISGVSIIIAQRVFFTPIVKKYGTLKVYQNIYIPYFFLIAAFPFTNSLVEGFGANFTWYVIMVMYLFRCTFGVFLYTSVNIIMSESAENHQLAIVNSLGQTFGCISRAIGPAATGIIFSWSISSPHIFPFDFHFTWFTIAIICVSCFITSKLIIRSK